MGYIPYVKLSRIWKTAVLYLLQNTKCITHEEADRLWKAYPNGLYSNKVRGRWKKVGFRLKRAVSKGPKGWLPWRSQLWRVYEADPLGCPLCGTEMELLELVVPP